MKEHIVTINGKEIIINKETIKLANFKFKVDGLLDELYDLVSNDMVNDGDTVETSQRITLLAAISNLDRCFEGVIASDLLATEGDCDE